MRRRGFGPYSNRRIPLATVVTLAAILIGCASRPKPTVTVAPTTRPVIRERPVLDIARGGGGLPVEDVASIDSRDDLERGLTNGFVKRVSLADPKELVTLSGDDFRHLELLRIDASGGTVRGDFKPGQYQKPGKPEPAIAVRRLEYLAWPLLYQNGATRWRLFANEAKLGLIRDQSGQDALVLTDARDGGFEFSMLLSDLRPMMMGGARRHSGAGFTLRDIDVRFSSDNPRSLSADVSIRGSFLFIPTSFTMHARADVDQWCNVTFSELSCKGDDAGGVVAAGFLNGAMQKYNGRTMPLVRWPDERIVLRDVSFKVDEALHISGSFEHNSPG